VPKPEVEAEVAEEVVDEAETSEEFIEKLTSIMDEKPNTDEDDYY